ncbi:50S ribosomal protein L13 [Buchnera aphidicola (Anoecia corni)]|uniref:Large ribosomal subunit protein uL13 n=1 Tax=Buchnera aphidicola (Anoecia corni) TaxID=2994477 RepID=A0AAT9IGB0_9GAMM
MKTFIAKPNNFIQSWYYIDATNKILGRLATQISILLRGKHKEKYTPNIDTGDYLIILNTEKIRVTGKKSNNKIYYHHTGYIGGIKKVTFKELIKKDARKILHNAVKGMMPKGPLGKSMLKKLKIYIGNNHLHVAQNPQKLEI